MQVAADAEIKLEIAILDIGRLGIFYASKDDDSLAGKFAGMPLIRDVQYDTAGIINEKTY